jgi:hypothetical protein
MDNLGITIYPPPFDEKRKHGSASGYPASSFAQLSKTGPTPTGKFDRIRW